MVLILLTICSILASQAPFLYLIYPSEKGVTGGIFEFGLTFYIKIGVRDSCRSPRPIKKAAPKGCQNLPYEVLLNCVIKQTLRQIILR